VFSILNCTSVLEESCVYSSVPAEAVAIAILNFVIPQFILTCEQKM